MTVQMPPSGTPITFSADVPAPSGMATIGGVLVKTTWQGTATFYLPKVAIDGVEQSMYDGGSISGGYAWFCVFPSRPAPANVQIRVNFTYGEAIPGSTGVVTIQGAETETGGFPMNPGPGSDPTFFGDQIIADDFKIVTWQEWRRLTSP